MKTAVGFRQLYWRRCDEFERLLRAPEWFRSSGDTERLGVLRQELSRMEKCKRVLDRAQQETSRC
jgi:hypothetical protein